MDNPKAILQRLVDLYKMTPSQVKKTLAADADNVYGLAWKDALDYIKKTPDSETADGTE
jgi:hypothetical protein